MSKIEIIISGDDQSGRTNQIINLARHFKQYSEKRVLIVCENHERAKALASMHPLPGIEVCGAQNLPFIVRQRSYKAILFDDFSHRVQTPEGDNLTIARLRLAPYNHPRIVYLAEKGSTSCIWVSTATWWKPWTWKNGHMVNQYE